MTTDPTDFLGEIDDINIEVDERAFGSLYDFVQWTNGNPAMATLPDKDSSPAYRGGWFYDADNANLELDGFEAFSKPVLTGKPIEGFASLSMKGQIIGIRNCFEVRDEENAKAPPQRFAAADFDAAKEAGRVRQRVHVLFLPEGKDDPIVLTLGGMTAAFFIKATRGQEGPYRSIGKTLCSEATKMRRRKRRGQQVPNMPIFGFMVELGSIMNPGKKKGELVPNFVEVGTKQKNLITPVAWLGSPDEELQADPVTMINTYWVGRERFEQAQQLRIEAEDWLHEWDPERIYVQGGASTMATASNTVPAQAAQTELPAADEVTL